MAAARIKGTQTIWMPILVALWWYAPYCSYSVISYRNGLPVPTHKAELLFKIKRHCGSLMLDAVV